MGDERKIEQLRMLCLDLNQLNHEITASFGAFIISSILSAFIILSIQFYTLYTIFEGFVNKSAWMTFYALLLVILHGGRTHLILLYNQFVIDEVSAHPEI